MGRDTWYLPFLSACCDGAQLCSVPGWIPAGRQDRGLGTDRDEWTREGHQVGGEETTCTQEPPDWGPEHPKRILRKSLWLTGESAPRTLDLRRRHKKAGPRRWTTALLGTARAAHEDL